MQLFGMFKRQNKKATNLPVFKIARVTATAPSPEHLRRLLFSAIAAGDTQQLIRLCRRHHQAIAEQRLIWTGIPREIMAGPRLLRWYHDGLAAISNFCEDPTEILENPEMRKMAREKPPSIAKAG